MAARTSTLRTAAILGALAIPFGLAVYQDRGAPDAPDTPEPEIEDPVAIADSLEPPPEPARDSMPAEFFDDVLGASEGRVGFAGELAGARLGASAAELEQGAPALWSWAELGFHPSYPEARVVLSFRDAGTRLESLRVVFPDADERARAALTAAWGPPLASYDGPTPRSTWFDAAQGLRVIRTADGLSSSLLYDSYQPLDQLLADAGDRFAFEPRPILGAPADELAADFAGALVHRDETSLVIYLPPTEFAVSDTSLNIQVEDGVAVGYWLSFEEPATDRALALFEARWGAPRTEPDGSLSFEDAPGARVAFTGATISASRRR